MSRSQRVHNDRDFDAIDQNLIDYEDLILGKLKIDLDAKDVKLDHKMREQFYSKLNDIDAQSAKILLCIEIFLVNRRWNVVKYDDNDCVNLLYKYLSGYSEPIKRFDTLNEFKIHYLLSDYYINWFKSDLRRSLFVASLIEDQLEGKTYQGELELLEVISDYLRYFPLRFNTLCSGQLI